MEPTCNARGKPRPDVVDEEVQSEGNESTSTVVMMDYREDENRDKAITDIYQRCGKYQDAIYESVTKEIKK